MTYLRSTNTKLASRNFKQQTHTFPFIRCLRMLHTTGLGLDVCNYVKPRCSAAHWWSQTVWMWCYFLYKSYKHSLSHPCNLSLKIKIMAWEQSEKVSESLLRLSPFKFFSSGAREGRCCQYSSCFLSSSFYDLAPGLPRASSIDAMDFLWVLITTGKGQEHIE